MWLKEILTKFTQSKNLKKMKKIFFLLLSISIWQGCIAQKSPKSEIFATTEGAIKGYDPVAYFNASKPIKGKSNIIYTWKGATWSFSSDENKQFFVANPEKYAPQYGGYCAYGWAQGYPAKIEPDAWSVVEGKLYLNYDKSVKATWDKDQSGYIKAADTNYQKRQLKQR